MSVERKGNHLDPDSKESRLDERQLLIRSREGDHNAFKEIVKIYENQVAATVIGMLGHCTEADDVGQETFIRFYKSMAKFRGESSLGTYLTRIAINLSLNELKRRQRKRKRFHDNPEERMEIFVSNGDPYKREDEKEMVRQAIQKLDPKSRAVIVLRLIDGFSTRETANTLKLPMGTVLSRLARGQMKLKEILTPLYEG